MGFLRRALNAVKNWFTGGNGSSNGSASRSASIRSANRITNYGGRSSTTAGSNYGSSSKAFREQLARQKEEEEKKRQKIWSAFKSTESKAGQSTSSSQAPKSNAFKASPPDPKLKAAEESRKRLRETAFKAKKEIADYHKATNNKYNPDVDPLARQRVKMGEYQSDPKVAKFEVVRHPIASSAARGALSGVTFGASDLLAKYGTKGESKRAEEYYQKHKNKTAETVGEIAGSLASFGMTGGASSALGKKVGGEALEKAGTRVAAKLAENPLVKRAAQRELRLAVKKGAVEIGSKEAEKQLLKELAENRAKRIVSAVGEDMAINLTTGAASDFNHAILDSDNPEEFAKNMGINAAMNLGIGGVTSVAPALRVRGGLPFVGGLQRDTKELLARRVEKEATDALTPLTRTAKETASNEARRAVDTATEVRAPEATPEVRMPEVRQPEPVPEVRPRTVAEITPAPARVEPPQPEVRIPEPEVRAPEPSVAETARREPTQAVEDGFVNPPREQIERWANDLEDVIKTQEQQLKTLKNGSSQWKNLNEQLQANKDGLASMRRQLAGEPIAPAPSVPESRITDVSQYASVDERIPTDDIKTFDENNAREEINAEVRKVAEEKPKAKPELKMNKVSEDVPLSKDLPEGAKGAKSAYEYTNGEKVEGGIRTSWNEAWKAAKEYAQSAGTGNRTRKSKVSASQINMMDSDAEREIRQKLSDQGLLDYDTIRTEEMYDKVSKELRDDLDHWVKKMIDINEGEKLDFRDAPDWQARTQYIMATIDPSADEASEIAYTEAFKLAKDLSSKGGQTLNLRRNFVHLTEAGKRDSALDDLANILNSSSVFVKEHAKDLNGKGKFDRINYIKGYLMENDAINEGIKKLVKANDPDGVTNAYAELMLTLNKERPKSKFDFIQELRYLNMLGNPKTHIRNVMGSGLFSPMRQISNAIRSGIEDKIATKAGLTITKHGGLSPEAWREARRANPKTVAGKKAQEAFEKLKPDILGSAKYDTQTYKGRSKTLAGKFFDALSDKNSGLLAKEDDFFRKRAFKENYIKSYNKYANSDTPLTPKIEKKIEAEAIKESQIATFNEFNSLAKFLNGITSKAYDANASTLEKGAGITMNAVMPFTKVPSNILKQSVNYSPAGIVRGLSNIKKAATTGDANLLNTAIDQFASGLTGTGVMALGMFAGTATNWFTTNAGKNDAAAKFKKQQGVQNYSVTFKNPADGKTYSMTLDWLVPTSSTFFMGVEFANQLKAGDFDLLDFGGDWAQISSRLIEPVLETSMLSGLYSMLESTRNGYGEDDTKSALSIMARETAQSYLNSLVPTVAGQISRTLYKNDKQITGETDPEYFKNQMKSKMGLGETNILGDELGADTDAYGNVKGQKNSLGDYGKSALKNFLSPANIQKVDLSSIDKQKIKQYEDAVKAGEDPQDMAYLFPKKQYKKQFKTGDMEVKLSNKDLSAYNQAKATGGDEGMRYILENIMFNRPTTDANGKKVPSKDAYTAEQKAKLIAEFDGKSIRDVEKWMYEQPQFKDASEAERRRAINGLWSYSNQGKAQASKRAGEQAVIEAQGGDVNEYNFNNEITEKKRKVLQPLIDSGVVSYEEAVDFARYAGKTYYYENEEGGTSQTYFNKGQMMEYLESKGYDEDKAAALFNAFKAWNAKEYGKSSGYRRYGRRRYGGYRRRGRGGSGKAKKIDTNLTQGSAFKSGNSKVKSYTAPKVSPPKASSKSATRSTTSTSTSTSRRVAQPKVSVPKIRTKVSAPSVSYKSMASASSKARKSSVSLAKMKYTPPKPKKGGK